MPARLEWLVLAMLTAVTAITAAACGRSAPAQRSASSPVVPSSGARTVAPLATACAEASKRLDALAARRSSSTSEPPTLRCELQRALASAGACEQAREHVNAVAEAFDEAARTEPEVATAASRDRRWIVQRSSLRSRVWRVGAGGAELALRVDGEHAWMDALGHVILPDCDARMLRVMIPLPAPRRASTTCARGMAATLRSSSSARARSAASIATLAVVETIPLARPLVREGAITLFESARLVVVGGAVASFARGALLADGFSSVVGPSPDASSVLACTDHEVVVLDAVSGATSATIPLLDAEIRTGFDVPSLVQPRLAFAGPDHVFYMPSATMLTPTGERVPPTLIDVAARTARPLPDAEYVAPDFAALGSDVVDLRDGRRFDLSPGRDAWRRAKVVRVRCPSTP